MKSNVQSQLCKEILIALLSSSLAKFRIHEHSCDKWQVKGKEEAEIDFVNNSRSLVCLSETIVTEEVYCND